MRQIVVSALAVIMALGLWAGSAHAQGVPGVDVNKCLSGKTKCVNKKTAGLLKCREKCQKSPDKCGSVQTACEDKVRAKFDGGTKGLENSCFGKLEAKSGIGLPERDCITLGDTDDMEVMVDVFVADVVATLEGSPPPACGDDVVNGVESCDGLDLGGATCVSLGFATGTLACTAGCGYDVSGCTATTCGNGTIEAPESCDGTDLGGASCVSFGFASGTLGCTAGCGYDLSGCTPYPPPPPTPTSTATPTPPPTPTPTATPSPMLTATPSQTVTQTPTPVCTPHSSGTYTDNCDGTVTDSATGLQWEKKTTTVGSGGNYDDPHDVDNRYTWTDPSDGDYTDPDGTAFTDFLAKLNDTAGGGTNCFAGHCDWRLPSEEGNNPPGAGAKELESILLAPYPCGTHPCIDPIFGPTASGSYWSSTTYADALDNAWDVGFNFGTVSVNYKGFINYVRAVRGGS